MSRVYVVKPKTGAIWSSAMPSLGVWRKESLGIKFNDTCQVGAVTQNFYPFSPRNLRRRRFQLLDK